MHPLISGTAAHDYASKAAVALERRGHAFGVPIMLSIDEVERQGKLYWANIQPNHENMLDDHRVTENGAEAVALVLAHVAKGWIVRRRLQRGEFADWLLVDEAATFVALEISGAGAVDRGQQRLREKVEQLQRSDERRLRVACVVEFGPPRVTLLEA